MLLDDVTMGLKIQKMYFKNNVLHPKHIIV